MNDLKANFSNIYCDKTKDKILSKSKPRFYKPVYRVIEHSEKILTKFDFYPTLMKKYNFTMPDESIQKGEPASSFSVSVSTSKEILAKRVEAVPSLRDIAFLATGEVNATYGTASEEDEKGHIHYFLFDPTIDEKNCYNVFSPVEEEEE